MGRKITMTGKNAKYIEHRAADATPDNDGDIRLEGDEAVYQEFAYGHASQPKQEQEPTEEAVKEYQKEAARKLLMDNAEYAEPIVLHKYAEVEHQTFNIANEDEFTPNAEAITNCFKFNSDFVKQSVSKLVAGYYHGNNANLALIEITLFHHQQLKRRNSHKAFVMSLAAWGLITIADEKEFALIVMGVGDKYKRLPQEGYKEWDDTHKEDRLACERIGEKLDSSMAYQH